VDAAPVESPQLSRSPLLALVQPPPVLGKLSPRRMGLGEVVKPRGESSEREVEYRESFKSEMVRKMSRDVLPFVGDAHGASS
jgi:hypothetical protein